MNNKNGGSGGGGGGWGGCCLEWGEVWLGERGRGGCCCWQLTDLTHPGRLV